MSESSEDLPGSYKPVQPVITVGSPQWFTNNWKAGLAFVYSVIVIMDFIVFPIYTGLHRQELLEVVNSTVGLSTELKGELIIAIMKPYAPKTLMGAGMFHLSFGALLTGATLKDKLKGGG